jgi:hypothetical protein
MSGSFVISTSIATGETMSTRQNLQPAPRFESGNELAVTREAMEGQFVCVELAMRRAAGSVKVEDAFGARKFSDAGACNSALDLDLTLATIRQAQPGATLDEIHRRLWILESPRPCRIGNRGGAVDRLDSAVALNCGRALTNRRAAVVAIHEPAP